MNITNCGKSVLRYSLSLLITAVLLLQSSTLTVASQSLPSGSSSTAIPTDVDLLPAFNQLLKAYSNCSLPCWWGFEPGKSKYSDFMSFLHKYSLDRHLDPDGDGSGIIYFQFLPSTAAENGSDFFMSFGHKGGLLSLLEIDFYNADQWLDPDVDMLTLSGVIKSVSGVPNIYLDGGSSIARFNIALGYSDVQVGYLLNLSAYQKDFSWAALRICPDLSAIREIHLNLQERDKKQGDANPGQKAPAKKGNWGDNFDTTETDFVNFFLLLPTECLETTLRGLPSTSTP